MFLSPPWGGPEYNARSEFDISRDIGSLGVNYSELMHIANSALHRPLASLASLHSFDRKNSQHSKGGDILEGQSPVTAAQLVLPSSQIRAEVAVEDAAVPEAHDESAETLSQLSQQRLLELADQTLAALDASGGKSGADEHDAQTLHGGDIHMSHNLGTAESEAAQDAPASAEHPSSAHRADAEQELFADFVRVEHESLPLAVQTSVGVAESKDDRSAQGLHLLVSQEEVRSLKSQEVLQTRGIACFLPKTTNIAQLSAAVAEGSLCEVERNVLNGRLKSITIYLGPCAV